MAPLTLRIAFEDERGRPRRVAVPVTVGRSAESTVRFAARNVSRDHARFTAAGTSVFVEDLGSRNGTFVNGARVRGQRRVRGGDVVRIGDETLRVVESSEEDTLDLSAPPAVNATPPPVSRRTPLPRRPHADEERTLTLAASTPRPRRWKEALAAALRVLARMDR